MHTPGYEDVSEYLHHFVTEENVHSWFFSNFCNRYGGKVYADKRMQFQVETQKPQVNAFLIFARIMILEEILDYYNVVIEADEEIPGIIRKMNAVHHYEESRHIAFGRAMTSDLFEKVLSNCGSDDAKYCDTYIERFFQWCVEALYNPEMYRDAGIVDFYEFRNSIMSDPGRKEHHDNITKKVRKYFMKIGVVQED